MDQPIKNELMDAKAVAEAIDTGRPLPDIAFRVQMTVPALFDFYLFHAYSKASGFAANVLGLAVAVVGVFRYVNAGIGAVACALYIAVAIVFLGYTPLTLQWRARKAMRESRYRLPVRMTFSEKCGIIGEQGTNRRIYPWSEMRRAVVTPKTIGIYLDNDEAIVIPKGDFGDQFVPAFTMITRQLGLKNVRMQ